MKNKINRKIRSAAKKLKLVDLLGGKCCKCSYDNKHLLQFHHTDPSDKSFNIGRNDFRVSKFIEESKKCILLCGNCHVLEHSVAKNINNCDRKRKLALLQYLGTNCCSKCGTSKAQMILEFHHKTKEDKEFTINSYRGSYINLTEEIKQELDKCVVLCRNCHFEEHFDSEFYKEVDEHIKTFQIREFKQLDEAEILRLYEEGRTCTEISKILDCNKSTISTILKRLGKGKYKKKDIMVNREDIARHIEDGLTHKEISILMKCSQSVISIAAKKLREDSNK